MKHFLVALLAVLSFLPGEHRFVRAVGCPRRYLRRINGKCYYFSVKKMNWFGALNNCLRKGLTLADLSNPRDFNGAVEFLSSKGNTEDFWFGGNDLQTEGRFQYASNGRLVRYYSNYSIVEPAMHSECDDCLEVRIRPNITVVADDNCMERQYFICSENYCYDGPSAKPRHHSHEHLHHFHHDIGEPSNELWDLGTPSPFDENVDEEDGNPDSEEATLLNHGDDSKDDENTEAKPGSGEKTTAEPGEVEETTTEGGGDETTADGGGDGEETTAEPVEGGDGNGEETTAAPVEGGGDGEETTAAPVEGGGDGEETTAAPVEGEGDGEETTAAPVEGGADGGGEETTAAPVEGGGDGEETTAAPVEGGGDGEETTAAPVEGEGGGDGTEVPEE